ncbi:hypothetical protein GCM10027577_29250 [Spirosoma fluminis]
MDESAKRVQVLMAEDNIESQKDLAIKLDRAPSLISGYLNSDKPLTDTFVNRLQDRLGWSARWIRHGEGPKKINQQLNKELRSGNLAVPLRFMDETEVSQNSYGMEFRDLDNGMVLMTMPLVDEIAYASYPRGFKDPEFLVELPRYSIVLAKREQGFFRAFEVRGDSMDDGSFNAICFGDVAIGKLIEPDYWDQKLYSNGGTDYIIVTHEGVILKRIIKHDIKEGIITCSSKNPDKNEYPNFEVSLTEVYELYKIRKVDRDWNRR